MGRDKMRLRGDRIRSLRQAQKWSQNDLAVRIGIQPSAIHRYETEVDRMPAAHTLLAISLALGVSLEYLLDLTDDPVMNVDKKSLPPGWRETVRELLKLGYTPEAAARILRALSPVIEEDLKV